MNEGVCLIAEVDRHRNLVAAGIVPDALTDQTSAHDALEGYVPHGLPYAEALALRQADRLRWKRRRRSPSGTSRLALRHPHARILARKPAGAAPALPAPVRR
jgi:urocanate hydratase